MNDVLRYHQFATPLGPMLAIAQGEAIARLDFVDGKHTPPIDESWHHAPRDPLLVDCAAQLRDYFAGRRRTFTLPVTLQGTPFQRRVWDAIAGVPFGETITYGELARRAGAVGSVRAAGAATGKNPIAVAIPCHRIIGANGHLTGYAGGMARKTHLLTLEGVLLH